MQQQFNTVSNIIEKFRFLVACSPGVQLVNATKDGGGQLNAWLDFSKLPATSDFLPMSNSKTTSPFIILQESREVEAISFLT